MNKSFAKINLFLKVLDKRNDGFHNIETIFHRINLYDEIEISESNKIEIITDNKFLPKDERNFCFKAALAIQNFCKVNRGVKINIKKFIPIGSGLGGGSSNAATVLKLLIKFWGVEITNTELNKIALSIGSDVSYFLTDTSAYATGRGEIINNIKFDFPFWIITVHPKIHIKTNWAYNVLSDNRKSVSTKFFTGNENIIEMFLNDLHKYSVNDFEEFIFPFHPMLNNIKNELIKFKATNSIMSGSGSSIFGLFTNEVDAVIAENHFKLNYFVSVTPPYFKIF
ncbi:MAG: 4-(cytidine 5'-diphospho)-2-C-methyl-D-erythritol kinase [Bacteroidetes bacterium]|nr:4-(cytidine 5'-diphospho)-2-C-methyl-D-erythritol kinase [Bacteroidota bacterium]